MKNSTKQNIKFLIGCFIAGVGIGTIGEAAKEGNKKESYIGYGLMTIGLFEAFNKATDYGTAETLEILNEQGAITNLTFDKKGNGRYNYFDIREILKK